MLLVKNRKALHNYEILEKFAAGIVLKGYEVKALREKKANFEGSYIDFIDNKPVVVGMHIGRYSNQSQENTNPTRPRQLLLQQQEIAKIATALNQKGKTAVPLALILHNNMIKLELAVVKGRKKYEKKAVAQEKQIQRELEQQTKEFIRS